MKLTVQKYDSHYIVSVLGKSLDLGFHFLRILEMFWVRDHFALLTTPYGKLQQKEYFQHGFHRYFSALRIKHCIDSVMLSYFWNKGFHKDLIIYAVGNDARELWKRPQGGGVLPYMGYIGMCGPKGYGFSAVLVIDWVSILAFLHPSALCLPLRRLTPVTQPR